MDIAHDAGPNIGGAGIVGRNGVRVDPQCGHLIFMAEPSGDRRKRDASGEKVCRMAVSQSMKRRAGSLALLVACQSWDRLKQAQDVLAKDAITTRDRWGQEKIHPATQVEREARAGLISALKLLDLDLETLTEDPKRAAKA